MLRWDCSCGDLAWAFGGWLALTLESPLHLSPSLAVLPLAAVAWQVSLGLSIPLWCQDQASMTLFPEAPLGGAVSWVYHHVF